MAAASDQAAANRDNDQLGCTAEPLSRRYQPVRAHGYVVAKYTKGPQPLIHHRQAAPKGRPGWA